MKLLRILFTVFVLLPSVASAVQSFASTPEEKEMCQFELRNYSISKVAIKSDHGHMHHYCDCLRFTNRAHRFPRGDKHFKFNIEQALDGCNYVIRKVSEKFYMLPDVYVARGKVYTAAKKTTNALKDFSKALQLNPNFEPAYIALIRYYQKAGDKKSALDLAKDGLLRNPDSKALKRRYIRLGGEEPFPGQKMQSAEK